jgi:alpha-L-fucosidase
MPLSKEEYLELATKTRDKRMKWWRDARFGMFVHWGLYSQLGRHEWVMNRERIPILEYEKLADTFKPRPRAAREWARLARDAGMKYMVMTTKHHEGFCLWDTAQHDYNAAKRGPKRDLVREYVEACREFGLRVGFYYSLMDWHHPDGALCATDEGARERFVAFTRNCVRELLSNYGRIDILWYDVSWPLRSPEAWGSYETNQMARALQPHILINNRSQLDEDFGTPEEHIKAESKGRDWEACMTFNGSWGWQPCPPADWHSVRSVLNLLRTCTSGQGNLLLNIGPKPDGSVPREAVERLTKVGRWLKTYGPVIYGAVDRVEGMEWLSSGAWTRKGKTLCFWCTRWPGRTLSIGGLTGKLTSARLFPKGRLLPFKQTDNRLVLSGLPHACPDKIAQVAVVQMEFKRIPQQHLGAGCVYLSPYGKTFTKWHSPHVDAWKMSRLLPKKESLDAATPPGTSDELGWRTIDSDGAPEHFINVHKIYDAADGLIFLSRRFLVKESGKWLLQLGHDGGAKVFVDGQSVYCDPRRAQPALPDRANIPVELSAGEHEIVIALDTDSGHGWGIFLGFAVPEDARTPDRKPRFPRPVSG